MALSERLTADAAALSVPDQVLRLRTAAWYGDRPIELPVPAGWDVVVREPARSPALHDDEIAKRIQNPFGQRPIAEIARGKRRPTVIVDDLNRPTPAARILPPLLRELAAAGIAASEVRLVMAPGTHGRPPDDAMAKKVGNAAATACQAFVHDCHRDAVRIGKTSFGTPVFVNRQVADSDLVLTIGGVYPNYTAGFGGGSKQVLGALGFQSIAALHFGHDSMGWGTPNTRSNFRRDLDEIARMVGLRTTISVLINPDREVADLRCGERTASYPDMLDAAAKLYRAAPIDGGFDAVIANTYPGDTSLTFARMKGLVPFKGSAPHTTRIAIGACPEGLGFHGLFPFMNAPAGHRRRMRMLRARILVRQPRRLVFKVRGRIRRRLRPRQSQPPRSPILLYRPTLDDSLMLPSQIPGMQTVSSWDRLVASVNAQHGGKTSLRVAVFPCASIQWVG